MSGPKGGLIVPGILIAISAARAAIELAAAANAARLRNLETAARRADQRKAETLQRTVDAATISPEVTKYAPEDAAQLTEQKRQALALITTGKRENERAESLRREAETLRQRAQRQRNSSSLPQVQDALRLERDAENKLREALECNRRAQNAFDSADAVGNSFMRHSDQSRQIAAEREAAAKIEEENQRRAVLAQSEINGLASSIGTLRHEKFAPGEFQPLSTEAESFRRAFASQDFAQAARLGEGLCPRLRVFEQKVSSLQTAFETAQIAAQNSLTAAKQEIDSLDRAELARWTGEDDAVSRAYSRHDAAAKMIDSEQFAEAENEIAASLAELRRIAEKAEKNKIASEQRSALTDVIMNALYEQGYDAPTYYYTQQKQDGSDIEFSDLTIFAKAPGERGDMRMNIDLDGKVKLEVEGIAEGEETVCHRLIQDLQQGVAGEIDFQMTDWGRAANVDTNAKVAVRQQEKTQERTRDRQNG